METIIHRPEIIRQWRTSGKLTQEDLAKDIYRSRYTVIRMEKGDTFVSLDAIVAVANRFGKPLSEVLNEEGKKKFAFCVA